MSRQTMGLGGLCPGLPEQPASRPPHLTPQLPLSMPKIHSPGRGDLKFKIKCDLPH